MKKTLVILALLLLCGCSATYNLEIKDDIFYETIEIDYQESDNQIGTELYEHINYLKDNDISPFKNSTNNEYYDKNVIQNNNREIFSLKYKYNEDSYYNSYLFSSCFEKNNSDFNNKYYIISLSGRYICNYRGDFTVKIKTNHKVIQSNANKRTSNNTYIWKVKFQELNDIYIKIDKTKKYINWYYIIIPIIIVVISAIPIKIVIHKIKNKNSI